MAAFELEKSVSATRLQGRPSEFAHPDTALYQGERNLHGAIIEQLIRPTGLCDPTVEVVPIKGQIPRLLKEIANRVKRKERVLVVTITKRLAEELTDYLKDHVYNFRRGDHR